MEKLFFAFMFILLISSASAMSQPEGFNGNVIMKGGGNVEGKTLAGFLNGEIAGSAIIHDNNFDIVITDEDGGTGGTIEFYIGDKKAKETFNFETFSVITTNLTFTISSDDEEIEFCGDNICNNGETCSTCSSDCGVCSSGSSSGGSGSGSSSGSSSNYISSSNSINNQSEEGNENEVLDLSIEKLKEKDKNTHIGTGLTIANFVKSGAGIILMLIVLVIALIVGVIAFKNKFNPLKWKKYR